MRPVLVAVLGLCATPAWAQVAVAVLDAPTSGEVVRRLQDATGAVLGEVSGLPVADSPAFTRPARRCEGPCARAVVDGVQAEVVVALDVRAVEPRPERVTVDVQVWVDGARTGTRTVQSTLAGYPQAVRPVLEALLPAWARAGFGGVLLEAPAGATVKVDGRPVRTTGRDVPLAAGQHSVDVVFDGRDAVLYQVLVEEGRRERLTVSRPGPAAPAPTRQGGVLLGLSYTSFMVGTAALAAGLIAGALARGTAAGLVPCTADTRSCATLDEVLERNRQAQAYTTTGNILLAAGGGLTGLSVALFIIELALR